MVPGRLSLQNFLCYRECLPLDFSGIGVACLTGDNGNGKSALLDAITWSLWGQARAKRDGDLVALGAADMHVDFEFLVGATRYRVIRKHRRTKSGAGSGALEFNVWDGETWRVSSGNTIRETQDRINDVLKISYETFVNSAFILQGRADLFTTKTPAERKQVLADILDLGRYDVYEARAKERRNERAQTVTHLTRQIDDAEVEIERRPALQAERATTAAAFEDITEQLADATAHAHELQARVDEAARKRGEQDEARGKRDHARDELGNARAQAAAARAKIAEFEATIGSAAEIRAGHERLAAARDLLKRTEDEAARLEHDIPAAERARVEASAELVELQGQVEGHRQVIEKTRVVVAGADEIRAGYARLTAARRLLDDLEGRRARHDVVRDELRACEAAIDAARAGLERSLGLQEAEQGRLAALAGMLDGLRWRREGAAREQGEVDAQERQLAARREEESEHRLVIESLKTHNARLREEMEELKRKRDELRDAQQHGAMDCPLCRSSLGREGLLQLEASYHTEGKTRQNEFVANRERIHDREASAQACAEKARRIETELPARRKNVAGQIATLDHQIRDAEEAARRLETLEGEVHAARALLDTGAYAEPERARRAALEAAIRATGYDRAAHEAARREAAAHAPYEQKLLELERAESTFESAGKALALAESSLTACGRRLDEATRRARDLGARYAELPLDAARRDVEKLAGFEERYRDLHGAQARLPEARDTLAAYESAAAGREREHDLEVRRLRAIEERLTELAGVETKHEEARGRQAGLSGRRETLLTELSRLKHEIDRLDKLAEAAAVKRRLLVEAQREQAAYEQLVRAFGKQGIQALIIEAALPEIEAAANDLLARMTNNRMHLTLKSQKDNQKGETRETLEIEIADEWGTRSYEMFSGGEAFRINLALRIALSKLLARRAGAPLPTLVIDEGFGTQDAAARERLIEAINVIQQDFQCLLLVTHIDELKDLFDTRIEVVKTAEGSIARVVAA